MLFGYNNFISNRTMGAAFIVLLSLFASYGIANTSLEGMSENITATPVSIDVAAGVAGNSMDAAAATT